MKLNFLFSLIQLPPTNAEYLAHINGYQYKKLEGIPFKVGDYVEFTSAYIDSLTFGPREEYTSKYKIVKLTTHETAADDGGGVHNINVIAELKINVPHKIYCLAWFKQPIKLNVKKL